MKLPTDFPYTPFYKTIGSSGGDAMIGAGFMRKPLARPDNVDFNPPYYSLCLVLSGVGELHDSQGTVWPLHEGMYFQRIPHFTHSNYIHESGSWVECFLSFDANLCDSLINMGIIDPRKPCGMGHDYLKRMDEIAQLRRDLEHLDGPELLGQVHILLHILHDIIYGETKITHSEGNAFLIKATKMLEDSIEGKFNIRQACSENGWGYEWFRKEFRRRTGVSPNKFRLRRRIDKARNLLVARRDLSLEDIASILGYCSVYEFSAQFKKYAGISPGKFRNG